MSGLAMVHDVLSRPAPVPDETLHLIDPLSVAWPAVLDAFLDADPA